jgi:hypothetical protein
MHAHQAGPAGQDDSPRTPASERLQLEVALLVTETTAPSDDAARAAQDGSLILLAVWDADIRDYIRQCLRGQPNFQIVEARFGDDPFDIAHRLPARLVISDLALVAGDHALLRGLPVLLTGVELTEQLPAGEGIRIAFLLQPFNARRLLEAVEHLLADTANG